ncbi:hypothetical protein BW723_15195 [Polaribacter reichenbachii]|uniref:Lipoprotein n=1 Tax=Polaribacter reichenbachii TaxID=996801 RepID=A0A1B8U5G2_9FLAO|nr:hypothetical protein [Polaribacter reichenbachii]APZ47548.1 hypothetical protein BW723_15195 [Polaribacter reichenbachii]AUC18188.1 hypothetical protein BTO17_05640 [Polaribacter reichenbachii]OBY67099.1 hypothetical protein LPB301_04595 [Polaribacter reichenbachii]
MKQKKQLIFLILTALLLIQCSPTLNYLGNNYAPTTDVSVYFDENEIQEKYKVMGLLTFNAEPIYDNDDRNEITTLIVNKGKEVGADAVLVTKFSSNVQQEIPDRIVARDSEKLFIEAKFLKFE